MAKTKNDIVFVTSSKYKQEENICFHKYCTMKDKTPVSDHFNFEIMPLTIKEILDVSLEIMVQDEVVKAYSQIKVPCIVEHAGLIFKGIKSNSYPGGLTKPMWNELGDDFIKETSSAGRHAVARAVIAYCDGLSVKTFIGETSGQIANSPKGNRSFYWDTIFMPEDPQGNISNKTYAEIYEDHNYGLEYKMKYLSQSSRAMLEFLEFLKQNPPVMF